MDHPAIIRGGFTWRVLSIEGDVVTVKPDGHEFTREWALEDLEPPRPDWDPVDDVVDE